MTSLPSPTRAAVVATVERYLDGLRRKDLSAMPLADMVTFQSPLNATPLHGRDAVSTFLAGMLPAILDVQVLQHIVEGEYCATRFDLVTAAGTIPVFDRLRVVDGQLVAIQPFYDPRPLTSQAA